MYAAFPYISTIGYFQDNHLNAPTKLIGFGLFVGWHKMLWKPFSFSGRGFYYKLIFIVGKRLLNCPLAWFLDLYLQFLYTFQVSLLAAFVVYNVFPFKLL
jgi:hypothetical protein